MLLPIGVYMHLWEDKFCRWRLQLDHQMQKQSRANECQKWEKAKVKEVSETNL